jgi:malonyl CoA-acyl carrier protein transacylase/ubiquinone/menaquinone biosynthesis C-methylase UbiE
MKDQENSRVDDSTISQAICSTLQLSLINLLRSWGLEANKVVGHSSGEIAAAYAAGALTFEDCLKVAYYRGIASAQLTNAYPDLHGSMLAIGASPEEVSDALERIDDGKAVIDCYNGPDNVTASGDEAAIEHLHRLVTERGYFSRKLRVSHAYHSHHMNLVQEIYRKLLGNIKASSGSRVEIWSSVSTEKIEPKEMGTDYWVENLLAPVKFSQALRGLLVSCPAHPVTLVEVGPHAALGSPIKSLFAILSKQNDDKKLVYASTLMRLQNATTTMLSLAGTLFCRGHTVNLSKVNAYRTMNSQDVVTDLPPYAWNHTHRFWHETRYARDYLQRLEARSDLLGSIAPDSTSLEPRWRNVLRLSEMLWLNDHVIQSQIVYPAAGYVAMAIEGSVRIAAAKNVIATTHMIREMSIVKALVLPEGDDLIEIAISFRPYSESHRSWSKNWNEFLITSWNSRSGWTENCRGLVSSRIDIKPNEVDGNTKRLEEDRATRTSWRVAEKICAEVVDVKQLYHQLSAIGMELGLSFQCIKNVCVGEGQAIGKIIPGKTAALLPFGFEFSHVIHPGTLDSLFQILLPEFYGQVKSILKPLVPTFIEELTISGSPRGHLQMELECYAAASPKSSREMLGSIIAHDILDPGTMIQIKGLTGTLLEPEVSDYAKEASQWKLWKISWIPDVDISPEFSFSHQHENSTNTDAHDLCSILLLEHTAWIYIDETLRKVGEKGLNSEKTHLVKLYRWMKEQKDPGRSNDNKANKKQPSTSQSRNLGTEGLLLDRIGTNLDKILKSVVSPLSLMTRDSLIEKYSAENLFVSSAIKSVAEYTKHLSFKTPDMHVLEIGAGTGAATLPILQALGDPSKGSPRFSRYAVTDASATVLEQIRPRFQNWGNLVDFGTLDIEVSPQMQSYRASSFDLIVAVNVLHKTWDIKRTFQNIRSLLKPGGKLLMIEMTKNLLHLQLIWGTLPEWWCGELFLLEEYRSNLADIS